MSQEIEVRKAWADFCAKAEAAAKAGYVIAVPGSYRGTLGVSSTAKVAPPAKPEPAKRPALASQAFSTPKTEAVKKDGEKE